MAKTIFQNLDKVLMGQQEAPVTKRVARYDMGSRGEALFTTDNKAEYETKLKQMKQNKLLAMQWRKSGYDVATENINGLTHVKLMYRDANLMDNWPEIGAALDLISEEACCGNSKGKIVNVSSRSERIKSILEDLFVNRLNIDVMLPMVCRAMCKYGNEFMLLNVSDGEGIKGWRELPVMEMERQEDGVGAYGIYGAAPDDNGKKAHGTKFLWVGKNASTPYLNWQVGHFRLITDSFFLPYGCSFLYKARRCWRMLSMMEDMMLIYRLERCVERRIFKIYVGTIDDADVPGYINDIANNFKRTPIIDPATGQVDLRKAFPDISSDYFIPVRTENASTPIENLPSTQSMPSMDDINYMENKVLSALRVPKSFLNFQDAQGKGQNLSLLDIRFARMVNRIQKALLMELNKIAIIHLTLLGFTDELSNFTLSMNNPSNQLDMYELDSMTKKIQLCATAVADNGNGIPLFSMRRAQKEILKWSDEDIENNLNELRLEKALSAELTKTEQIIKRTNIFDPVDRIYGEVDAQYSEAPEGEEGGPGGGGGPMGGPMPSLGGDDFGEDIDNLGGPGSEETGEISGNEGAAPMENAPEVDAGQEAPSLQTASRKPRKVMKEGRISEYAEKVLNGNTKAFNDYMKHQEETSLKEEVKLYDKGFLFNDEIQHLFEEIGRRGEEETKKEKKKK